MAGIALLVARHGPAGPVSLVVIPSAEQAEEQGFADGLAQAVAAELTHDSAWRVVAWPRFAEYRQTHGGPGSLTTGATAKDLSAGAVLTVGTRLREGRRLVFAVLMQPEQGFKDWAGEYERGLTDEFAVQRELARSIAGDMDRRPSSDLIGIGGDLEVKPFAANTVYESLVSWVAAGRLRAEESMSHARISKRFASSWNPNNSDCSGVLHHCDGATKPVGFDQRKICCEAIHVYSESRCLRDPVHRSQPGFGTLT